MRRPPGVLLLALLVGCSEIAREGPAAPGGSAQPAPVADAVDPPELTPLVARALEPWSDLPEMPDRGLLRVLVPYEKTSFSFAGGRARGYELELFRLEQVFRHYADRYGFDWLEIAALAYQESQLDPSRRSPRGAVGVMQILPSTAADPNVGIPDVSSLEQNVHAGVRYLAFLRDRYFSDAGISASARFDFALAAYNAGPGRVADFRRHARTLGLDPNRWFRNVEVAALEQVGRETVRHVARVNEYYVAYRLARRTERLHTAALAFP